MTKFEEQLLRVREGQGFFAALDQSGGSTPKALAHYGIPEDEYVGEEAMFDKVHAMRSRIMANPSFDGDRIIAAILFKGTMDRQVEGLDTARYLWERKRIVPFVKVDEGLSDASRGAQLMKPMPGLDALLERALEKGVFGTKMRSMILEADEAGIEAVVAQQFDYATRIASAGLVPIVEPEVAIHSTTKAEAEALLIDSLLRHLDDFDAERSVVLKLSLPETPGFYERCVSHPKVARVVALSGGYSRDEANERLRKNPKVIASFSRALSEDLRADQSNLEFTAILDRTIEEVYEASLT